MLNFFSTMKVCFLKVSTDSFIHEIEILIFDRWTTAYGEGYDYNSIMHYSARAFSKEPFGDDPMLTITPKNPAVNYTSIGRKVNLSETDIIKIKKLYKCPPYREW